MRQHIWRSYCGAWFAGLHDSRKQATASFEDGPHWWGCLSTKDCHKVQQVLARSQSPSFTAICNQVLLSQCMCDLQHGHRSSAVLGHDRDFAYMLHVRRKGERYTAQACNATLADKSVQCALLYSCCTVHSKVTWSLLAVNPP